MRWHIHAVIKGNSAVSDTSAPQTGSVPPGPPSAPPLFYKQPEPLFPGAHKDFKIRPENDFTFAAKTNSLPTTVPEFAFVARHYPIVFLGPELIPTAVVGVTAETNLFVNNKGEWDNEAYIPAFVRRYPFIFLGIPNDDKLHLGVDGAGRSDKPNARGLFDGETETDTLKAGLDFCQQFHGAFQATREFSKALLESGIVEDSGVEIQSPTGDKQQLGPFGTVTEEKFKNLPDATIVDWHKRGFLHMVHFHLQSLTNWQNLLQRSERKLAA